MTARSPRHSGGCAGGGQGPRTGPSLYRLNQGLLAGQYDNVVLIGGNDTRGIDVGSMTNALSEQVGAVAGDPVRGRSSGDPLAPKRDSTTTGLDGVRIATSWGSVRDQDAATCQASVARIVTAGRLLWPMTWPMFWLAHTYSGLPGMLSDLRYLAQPTRAFQFAVAS